MLKRQAWRGLLSKMHGPRPKLEHPDASGCEGSPGSPPGAEWRSPDEVGLAHRKNSNLSGCKLEQLLSGSDVKNHAWIGMANG